MLGIANQSQPLDGFIDALSQRQMRETAKADVSAFRKDLPLGRYLPGVAAWDPDAETKHPVDFRLVHNTFVTMYWRSSLLDETIEWLRSHAYDVVEFDAASWASAAEMLDDVAAGLDFPDYFGRNLDALNDCMRDVASGEYGWHPDATGLVIVLRGLDAFTSVDRRTAQILLDIFADQARCAILIGNCSAHAAAATGDILGNSPALRRRGWLQLWRSVPDRHWRGGQGPPHQHRLRRITLLAAGPTASVRYRAFFGSQLAMRLCQRRPRRKVRGPAQSGTG